MNFLDVRTLVFGELITDTLCVIVLIFLWLQNRKRYAGMFFWVLDFIFQTAAVLLIVLRGFIPDWASIGLSSPLVFAGAYMGFLGLERFVGKRSSQIYNYILLGILVLVHLYFTGVHADLAWRNLNVSIGLLVVCFQCAWLMMRWAGRRQTLMTRAVGWVFELFCVVSAIRIFIILANPQPNNDLFQSGLYDTLILMAYQILLILLTFSLALMVNWRLLYEVRGQEEKFTKVFQSSAYAILITRLSDGLIVDVNRGFEEMFGFAAAEAVGNTTFDLHLWVKETDRQLALADLSARGEVQGREFEFRTKSGRLLTGLFYAEILTVENEELILSSINDISERKQADEKLREDEARLRLALNAAKGGAWEWNLQTNQNIWSEELWKVYGLEPFSCEPSYEAWLETVHPDDRESAAQAVQKATRESGELYAEWRVRERDGTERWLMSRGQPVFEAGGQVIRYIGTVLDITERKQAEKVALESRTKLEAALNSMADAVFISDTEGNFIDFNDAFASFHRFNNKEECAKTLAEYPEFLDVFWPDGTLTPIEMWAVPRALRGEIRTNAEYILQRKDTNERWVGSYNFAPIRDKQGVIVGSVVVGRDITERKRSEQALRESEEKFRKAFLTSPDAISINRLKDGKYISINNGFCQMMGYSAEEVTGKTSVELDIWADPQDRRTMVDGLTRKGEISNYEVRFRAKNGEIRDGRVSASVFDLDLVPHIMSIIRDITAQKKIEAELRKSEEVFSKTFHSSPMPMTIASQRDGTYLEVNQSFLSLIECSREEVIGHTGLDLNLIEAEGRAEIMRNLRQLGTIHNVEVQARTKTGRHISLLTSIENIELGGEACTVASMLDNTERKQAEEMLRESEERYRTVADYTYDWEYWRAPGGKLLYSSPSSARITGYKVEEFMEDADLVDRIVHPDDMHLYEEHKVFAESGEGALKVHELDFRILRKDGQVRWIGHTCQVLHRADGTSLGRRATNRDITERKLAEEEIRQLNESLELRVRERTAQLESANKELEAFAYSVSHDLRTPLRGIDGWSLALLEDYQDQLDERGRTYLGSVRAETQRMGQLIDDLLKLSRVTRTEMQFSPVDLSTLAQSIIARLKLAQPDRQVEVVVQPGLTCRGDVTLLSIVLTNLFDNAWKFTANRAEARVEFGKIDLNGQPAFFVRDNGVGFEMMYSQKLFGAFQRLHKSSEFPGTGIGLATVQRIIHRHGGRVWVDAQLERGATFFFTIQGG